MIHLCPSGLLIGLGMGKGAGLSRLSAAIAALRPIWRWSTAVAFMLAGEGNASLVMPVHAAVVLCAGTLR